MYKLGIDVGGTNTDAVLIDENRSVVADIKYPTSADIYDGILGAMRTVLDKSGVDPKQINQAMLGTTQCTNAIVERRNLAPIGILRIGAPASTGIRPMVDWADDIRRISAGSVIIGGGFEYDGKELAPFDREGAEKFFTDMKEKGVKSIAVSCVFSTVRNDHELEAARLCRQVMGDDVHVSISSEIGSMGLIERENATILNAALWQVAERFTDGFAKSLQDEGITNADVYLSQNDGTLMTMEHARRYPILTVACGPTNSIRGASYLSNLKNAIVVDVGGTTTDLGVIQNGFPRESSVAVTIGGVRTNFRMPDVISIGLGGGSIVRVRSDGSVTVGPDSVGYEITKKALVFGGDVMTATDIAVRCGLTYLGDAERTAGIPREVADKALAVMRAMVEDSVDSMKVSNADADLILVGGGSVILPEDISGASSVLKPEHFGCANAIGSAISKVSGTYEKLVDYDKIPRDQALENARAAAVDAAVEAGAVRDTVEIIEMEDFPLAYYPGHTSRVKVKAAGDLR
ncbi:hydantoinase/oxoprolinase family protein [Ligilactobacillus ruminis]|uniref:hydantoinase/oxoprolinase family protein n=1 Tax=Ligilactobacillus ruminis TaxID=1623 RepID=UPI001F46544C|nr:hydantoinase/oxoprolinase family protein [Ligilactobacillus ruminis]MCF2544878.1 hydantoinase/oxoprolinase family protein [Ligilactobacillus ruminis]